MCACLPRCWRLHVAAVCQGFRLSCFLLPGSDSPWPMRMQCEPRAEALAVWLLHHTVHWNGCRHSNQGRSARMRHVSLAAHSAWRAGLRSLKGACERWSCARCSHTFTCLLAKGPDPPAHACRASTWVTRRARTTARPGSASSRGWTAARRWRRPGRSCCRTRWQTRLCLRLWMTRATTRA